MSAIRNAIVTGTGILAASPAFAHTGGELSVVAGMLHPLTGLDHLLAMVGVGILAASRPDSKIWRVPAAFIAALAAGSIAGLAFGPFALAEPGILASLVVFGGLIAFGERVPLPAVIAVTALFGLAHGTAHGAEAAGATAVYLIAFLATSAALHAGGVGLARRFQAWSMARLATGIALGASALVLSIG